LTLDDPRLKRAAIGVQMIGNDSMNTPPAHAIASRGIVDNVRGYMVYGDYRRDNPPAAIIDAVVHRQIDVGHPRGLSRAAGEVTRPGLGRDALA
jgi:mxaJ protein